MEKRELEVLWNYYLGMSKVKMIWEDEMDKLHESKIIKKIYEVIDNDFNEVWYLIRDIKETSYIVKSKYGNLYSKDIMKKYKTDYEFYMITTDIIKIFQNGFFPIVFKVSENNFNNFYDEKSNKTSIFFNNYYCRTQIGFKAVREYRNKVEYEVFDTEDDAILWASDYSKTKQDITKKNIRPLNLNEMVYEYKIEKG